MATKANNRMDFYGRGYGFVTMVRKSVAQRWFPGCKPNPETGLHQGFYYWRGQLVHDWEGENENTGERWRFSRGRVIWLDARIFFKLDDIL